MGSTGLSSDLSLVYHSIPTRRKHEREVVKGKNHCQLYNTGPLLEGNTKTDTAHGCTSAGYECKVNYSTFDAISKAME